MKDRSERRRHTGTKLQANDTINLSRRYSDTRVLAKTDIKPRDLGILTQASHAIQEARDDDFLTIKTDETRRDTGHWSSRDGGRHRTYDTRDQGPH